MRGLLVNQAPRTQTIGHSLEEFTQAVEDYIQWYNTERIQQRLKGLTPMHYRNQALETLTT
ncbi:IS3 family transposase [Corynebacterium belfantii]|uniref:IS3 family transposase n=1 Tax=Corynebacterium belfantii TaxID=2014537 RepID=UPI00399CFD43